MPNIQRCYSLINGLSKQSKGLIGVFLVAADLRNNLDLQVFVGYLTVGCVRITVLMKGSVDKIVAIE